jgi:hypothetical protein
LLAIFTIVEAHFSFWFIEWVYIDFTHEAIPVAIR